MISGLDALDQRGNLFFKSNYAGRHRLSEVGGISSDADLRTFSAFSTAISPSLIETTSPPIPRTASLKPSNLNKWLGLNSADHTPSATPRTEISPPRGWGISITM